MERKEEPLLSWSFRPQPLTCGRISTIVAAAFAAGSLGWLLFHSALFVLIGILVVAAATADYLLPARYRLTSQGASAIVGINWQSLPWSSVTRVQVVPGGILLSPVATPGRLDAFRGVLLRFAPEGPGTKDAVLTIVRERVPNPGGN